MYLLEKARHLVGGPIRAGGNHAPGGDLTQESNHSTTEGAQHLSIPCPNPTDEDTCRDSYRLRGQFLARQDRWQQLVEEIRRTDAERARTPAAMPIADLLCFGARSDVVAAVEHALLQGRPARDASLFAGIEALEEMLAEDPNDPIRAVIVAQAHMDLGWAWRGSDWHGQIPEQNLEAFAAHFDRARDILSLFGNNLDQSPLFVSTSCSLCASGIAEKTRLAQEYEKLIDLDPLSPAPMRAMGTYLSPKWFGSHEELELEARRTAARLIGHWGAGGYTWVMFDALAGDPIACANLDVEYFVEGVQDILDRMPDQHTVNTFAAYCAVTLGSRRFEPDEAERNRAAVADCARWIVRNCLTELHPMVWAHAAVGFGNNPRITSARKFAATGLRNGLCKVAEAFSKEISDGYRITFTADGPVAEHV